MRSICFSGKRCVAEKVALEIGTCTAQTCKGANLSALLDAVPELGEDEEEEEDDEEAPTDRSPLVVALSTHALTQWLMRSACSMWPPGLQCAKTDLLTMHNVACLPKCAFATATIGAESGENVPIVFGVASPVWKPMHSTQISRRIAPRNAGSRWRFFRRPGGRLAYGISASSLGGTYPAATAAACAEETASVPLDPVAPHASPRPSARNGAGTRVLTSLKWECLARQCT